MFSALAVNGSVSSKCEKQQDQTNIYIYAFSRRFYPKRLSDSGYIFVLSVCVFPGNQTHNLCAANAMLYHWATGTELHTNSTQHWTINKPHLYRVQNWEVSVHGAGLTWWATWRLFQEDKIILKGFGKHGCRDSGSPSASAKQTFFLFLFPPFYT